MTAHLRGAILQPLESLVQPTSRAWLPIVALILGFTLPAPAGPRLVNVGDRLRKAAIGADRLELLEASSTGWPVLSLVETDKGAIAAFLAAVQTEPVKEGSLMVVGCECGRRVRLHRGQELVAEFDYWDAGLSIRSYEIWPGFHVRLTPESTSTMRTWMRTRLGPTFDPSRPVFLDDGEASFFVPLPWHLIPEAPVAFDATPFVRPAPNPITKAIPGETLRLNTVISALDAFGWDEPAQSQWPAIALDAVDAIPPRVVEDTLRGAHAMRGVARLLFGPRPPGLIPWAERLSPKTVRRFLDDYQRKFALEDEPCDPTTRLRALHGLAPAHPAPCDDAVEALPELQWAVARADAGLPIPEVLLHAVKRLTARVDLATLRVAEALQRGWPADADLAALDWTTADLLRQRLARSPTTDDTDRAVGGLLVHESGAVRRSTLDWLAKVSGLAFPDQADPRDSAEAIRAWWRAERSQWRVPDRR